MSAGNVRIALDRVKGFLGSGHVDTEKIIQTFEDGGYIIALHEVLRAVIYGDSIHYEPDRSPIANLFDLSRREGTFPAGLPNQRAFVVYWARDRGRIRRDEASVRAASGRGLHAGPNRRRSDTSS